MKHLQDRHASNPPRRHSLDLNLGFANQGLNKNDNISWELCKTFMRQTTSGHMETILVYIKFCQIFWKHIILMTKHTFSYLKHGI